MAVLFAYAAEVEGKAIADKLGIGNVVELGVGKVQAAANLSAELQQRRMRLESVDLVILFGVAGAYCSSLTKMGAEPLEIGQICLVESDCLADEGVCSEDGFTDLAGLGLGEVGPWRADAALTKSLARQLRATIVKGATVSTCSGKNSLAREMAVRSGAQVETMEGAAVAWVCRKFAVPFVQIRCISNWTGDRKNGLWNLPMATANLQQAIQNLDLVRLY